jgi:adenylate cyclase
LVDPPVDPPINPAADPAPGTRESLARFHLTPEDLERAESTSELALVSLQRAFAGRGQRYDMAELAEALGLQADTLLALWRSLGFTEPRPGERVFSDSDIRMLAGVMPYLADGGLPEGLAMQLTRVIGSAMSRIANAQVDAIITQFEAIPPGGDDLRQEAAVQTAGLLAATPDVLEFVWRRHVVTTAHRRMVRTGSHDTSLCVGFADLVGFTAHAQQLTDRELAEVVERFEKLAFEVVSGQGGRVVKMIGDEVLFVADDVVTGAHIALAVADAYRDDPALSDVRVGLAAGAVLERDGDVYGPVVNLANRIVRAAFPGSVVVSSEVADAVAGETDMVVRPIRSQRLKDIGTVPLWTLRPGGRPDQPDWTRSVRHHLRDRREELSRRRSERQQGALAGLRELGDEVDPGFVEQSTGQIEAVTDAVLAANLEPDLQTELLADIDAARRLHSLEQEADRRSAAADAEAEDELRQLEVRARRKVEQIEAEARRRIEGVLAETEREARRVGAQVERTARRVGEDLERKAGRAERDAARSARRRTIKGTLRRRRRS